MTLPSSPPSSSRVDLVGDENKRAVADDEDTTEEDAPPPNDDRSSGSGSVSGSSSGGSGAATAATDAIATVRSVFELVAEWIRETPVVDQGDLDTATTEQKLRMYGLYKRVVATTGSTLPNAADRPPAYRVRDYYKYRAWEDACRDYPVGGNGESGGEEQRAMEEYVRIAASQPNWLGERCDEQLQRLLILRRRREEEEEEEEATESGSGGGSEKRRRRRNGTDRRGSRCDDDEEEETPPSPQQRADERGAVPPTSTTTTNPAAQRELLVAVGRGGSSYCPEKISFGVRPLVPRGQLDISFSDLAYGAYQACRYYSAAAAPSSGRYRRIESSIVDLWNGASSSSAAGGQQRPQQQPTTGAVVVGLSVRSLLDLYLTARQYPKGSEIVVTPPINVPGMLHVLEYHGITVVPVDLPPENGTAERRTGTDEAAAAGPPRSVKVDVEGTERAITSKTVAVLVVHPFGAISASAEDMERIRAVASARKIHLLEDCAECFTGLGRDCYRGSPSSDLCFFSFGLIKSATALGGGIATVKDSELADHMHRLQQSIYRQQSQLSFLRRILVSCIFLSIAKSPLLYGLIHLLCTRLGIDFDALVTNAVRSFSPRQSAGADNITDKRIRKLRRTPCQALLALLHRRLSESRVRTTSAAFRRHQCQRLTKLLGNDNSAVVPIHAEPSNSTYWIYPILSDRPDAICKKLRQRGFDSTRGSSQLVCIGSPTECPRATAMMNRILYLPVSGRPLSSSELCRLVGALREASEQDTKRPDRCSERRNRKTSQGYSYYKLVLSGCLLLLLSWRFWSISELILGLGHFAAISLFFFFGLSYLLRWSIASRYMDSTTNFARHSSLLFPTKDESGNIASGSKTGQEIITSMGSLEIPSCDDIEGRKVMITGATGFIGSLLLRDLLLHRESFSICQVLVLCRSKRGCSAEERFCEVLRQRQFDFLSDDEKRELVKVVEGDITKPDAGLGDSDLSSIRKDSTVTHIFHCAASISFTQSFPDAAKANISSALYLQQLASSLSAKHPQFVHVSTAFVHGGELGTNTKPLTEQLYPLGCYDPGRLYRSMLDTQFHASKAMNDLGFHNTYTFSKCVCEHLLSERSDVDTTIIRPSIVGPSLENPSEGWAGSRPSTLIAAACLYFSYQWNMWSFGNQKVPYIPVDVVTRFILVKAFARRMILSREVSNDEISSSDSSYEKIGYPDGSSTGSFEAKGESPPDSGQCETRIYNAVWDVASSPTSAFTWFQYAFSVGHTGPVLGFFSRPTAYAGLWLCARLLPHLSLSAGQFARLHGIFVLLPFRMIQRMCRLLRMDTSDMDMVSSFLDLPLLFYPFMNNSFFFQSELVAPPTIDGSRYLFNCTLASCKFMERVKNTRTNPSRCGRAPKDSLTSDGRVRGRHNGLLRVGGYYHRSTIGDGWWAITQPRGNLFVRLAAWALIKIFRATCSEISIDAASFAAAAAFAESKENSTKIILAPTHRSFFDSLVISFILFSIPEFQFGTPFIAAADDFESLPIIGFLAHRAGAFFIRRGRKRQDPRVKQDLHKISNKSQRGPTIEIFIEGTRSRDRRFLDPKTGLLRCLTEEQDAVIVPITVNYERIPEQEVLSTEAAGGDCGGMSLCGLLRWLFAAMNGEIFLGKIHVAIGKPHCSVASNSVSDLADSIQHMQQTQIYVSDYHIEAASRLLGQNVDTVREGSLLLGCKAWPKVSEIHSDVLLPTDGCELATVMLHASPFLARLVKDSRPEWSKWMNRVSNGSIDDSLLKHPSVAALSGALLKIFDEADACTERAIRLLNANGFSHPKPRHVLQASQDLGSRVPGVFQWASVCMQLRQVAQRTAPRTLKLEKDLLGQPTRRLLESDEALGFWGFADSSFFAQMGGNGTPYVSMRGSRYSLSDRMIAGLMPFIEEETQVRINLLDEAFQDVESSHSDIAASRLKEADIEILRSTVGRVSVSVDARIRSGTGHSQEDVFLIRSGQPLRVADAVVSPLSEESVENLTRLATSHSWCLIPVGGGTNVSQATRCPPVDVESRPIISVNMKKMNKVLWIDEENGLARVEAGITGRELVQQLASRGYTLGHEPDSIEFSTVGGWIATKASGMKRNKYGNIEDIVKSVRVCGSRGILHRDNEDEAVWGRESCGGLDLCDLMLGSEGCLGIVTSAVLRIWPLPDVQDYDGILLSDFNVGTSFIRAVSRLGPGRIPVSVRLLDNEHFRLGQALSPQPNSLLESSFKSLAKLLLQWKVGGADWKRRVVLVTVSYEGSKEEVVAQKTAISRLSGQHGGLHLGASAGKSCYDMTFMIAYLRDFAMTYHFLGESFETFVPWSRISAVMESTKQRIRREHASRYLPGRPFIGCRITQLYHEGVCLYFYFCMNFENVPSPSRVFADIERAARRNIIDRGGSLSHHHGVGKLRSRFLKRIHSPALQATLRAAKSGIDPNNIFGARNGVFALSDGGECDDDVVKDRATPAG